MSSGSFVFAWVNLNAIRDVWVHSVSRGLTGAGLGVVVLTRNRLRSLERAKGSSGSFVFAWVHSGAPRVSRVHSGSLGFTRER